MQKDSGFPSGISRSESYEGRCRSEADVNGYF